MQWLECLKWKCRKGTEGRNFFFRLIEKQILDYRCNSNVISEGVSDIEPVSAFGLSDTEEHTAGSKINTFHLIKKNTVAREKGVLQQSEMQMVL